MLSAILAHMIEIACYRTIAALCLAVVIAFSSAGLAAPSTVLDDAVRQYYAGQPRVAIGMLEPLAVDGDVDAQYLLGNILYTLANAGRAEAHDDPGKWYRMAAAQNSAPAIYALGAIHNNRWLQSHRDEDAELAQAYFQRALQLGDENARAALTKLKTSRNTGSLTYSNESFSSKREPPAESRSAPQKVGRTVPGKADIADALSGFESSGDPVADARQLKALLASLNGAEANPGEAQADTALPGLGSLSELLDGFESAEQLLGDLLGLFDHLEKASEIDTAPGSN